MKDYSRVTIYVSLPRTRSQWMANFYSYATHSWHDPLKDCSHPGELVDRIDDWLKRYHESTRLFIADTAFLLFRDYLVGRMPGVRLYHVWRSPVEVQASIERQVPGSMMVHLLPKMARRLMRIGDPLYNYADLDRHAREWFPDITGLSYFPLDDELYRLLCHRRVDVPLLEQSGDPVKTRALLRYSEIR